MTSNAKTTHPISVEDYLQGEQVSEIRHEFVDGQVYAMVGASRTHALIVNALAFALTPPARSQHCQLFTSDMKVRLDFADNAICYYPDLVLTCDPADQETYYSSRPCLIIEVLSDSTERIDRGEKLVAYQRLPSLQEYLLVSQDVRHVEVYRRGNDWKVEQIERGKLWLDCLSHDLALDAIYADVSV